ncbi:ShlB/FhaC/HecB family hemolysin secretion/activation protein [Denitratisoma oestradiolicum]|uniref:ShlB/FhaC/HecB family hemolysin secretion/activation protein n=1 Tax=Denitratisoma oestradiolicum TaxID=311182 RepID=UPI00147754ED|nr:ShlB/FhaC/HecB family hemolysin secretion/activation protein [Denitratisoma oestradiolicum]
MKRNHRSVLLGTVVQVLTGLAWAQPVAFDISGFKVEGGSLLTEEVVQRALVPHAGAGRTMDDVKRAAGALKDAYAQAGYPVVQVFPPEQTAAGGVITLRVIEGRVAKVTVAGNKVYDEANIRASLPALKEGKAPHSGEIVADIVLANENPAKQVAVNFQASGAPGDIDARVDVVEDRTEKYTVTVDNAGSRSTGMERIGIAYQNANLMNRDHMLTLQYMTTYQNPDKVGNLTVGYRIPFYAQGLSLDLIAAYSDTKSTSSSPAGALFFSGKGSYFGTRLNQALPSQGEYRHKLVYGLDYKDFNNDCSLGGTALNACGTITSMPASLSYVAQLATPAFQAGGNIGYYVNIVGGPHGSSTAYGTRSRQWDAWRASGFVAVPLKDWQARATLNFQESSKALIASEQFGIGGASSVRGYDERTASGDYGASANLEIYTPDLASSLGLSAETKLRALAFHDLGYVHNITPGMIGETKLSSIGLGMRLNYGKDLAVRLDVGFVQSPTHPTVPVQRDRNKSFGHLAVSYSF